MVVTQAAIQQLLGIVARMTPQLAFIAFIVAAMVFFGQRFGFFGDTTKGLAEAIQHFLPQLKGTTAFPDVSRPQSPYERIDESTWAMAAGAETGQVMDQCVNGACPVR